MIKEHPWFDDLEFDKLLNFEVKAPFVPEIDGIMDVKNFDSSFTDKDPRHTKRASYENPMIEHFDKDFVDFEYSKIEKEEKY